MCEHTTHIMTAQGLTDHSGHTALTNPRETPGSNAHGCQQQCRGEKQNAPILQRYECHGQSCICPCILSICFGLR